MVNDVGAEVYFKPDSGQLFVSTAYATPSAPMDAYAEDIDVAIGAVECVVKQVLEGGDHSVVIAEVTEAHLMKAPEGRADAATLEMKDLGDNVYYGG